MEKSELEVMLALGDFAFFNAGSAVAGSRTTLSPGCLSRLMRADG